MAIYEGQIEFRTFAMGSKSESLQPYFILEDGQVFRARYVGDNPFENKTLMSMSGKI